MHINGLIGYYRDCFKEDSADFNLRNLMRLNKEDLLVIKGVDEIASGELHRLPIPPVYGESFAKRADIYQREKVLLHCSLFVVGKLKTENDTVTLFSPLVFSESKIESDEYGYYFSSEHTSPEINEELLSLLLPESDILPNINPVRIYDPSYWSDILQTGPFEINYLESLRFPTLASREDVTRAMRRKNPSLLAVSTLAFVERSASSRGVLHELSEILDRQSCSAPLTALLDGSDAYKHESKSKVNYRLVPALLSSAQKGILDIAANQPLGVVSGPPGTGKSYTIGAAAAEHFTRGQSVLIVASSETALDVIADKLASDFGLDNLFVRVGQKTVLKEFKQYLNELLAGYYDHSDAKHKKSYQTQLNQLISKIESDEHELTKLSLSACKLGLRSHRISNKRASLWDQLLHKLSSQAIKKLSELWVIQSHFNDLLEQKEALSTRYLKAEKASAISALLKADRKVIQTLNKAVRARTSAKQAEYFSSIDFKALLTGFPVWLVSLSTLHKVLPLEQEMFDLVIIDEATQSNIASALPAMERAKRALVVGDQKQLRHFSFLAKSKERQLAKENLVDDSGKALSYRDNSVLDLTFSNVNDQNQVAFLDEHFRSQPELIHFSNQHFYSNKLKVMQHRPCSTTGHAKVLQCNGKRLGTGVNENEANEVLKTVQQFIQDDSKWGVFHSIGILSPFRKQSKYLSEVIEKNISLSDIQKHQIKVSTPYGFQGEERDIMLLSFCIDNDSKRAAAYLNKPDVFNVAITRARKKQFIYKSINEASLPANNLLKQYLESLASFTIQHQSEHHPDEFQTEVINALESLGAECWQGYEMLGTYMDILVRMNKKYVAVDLIGFPGPWDTFFELNTYKVIKRAGINVFPLSYALWLKDREVCVEALMSCFE
jgi:hypothetical protein